MTFILQDVTYRYSPKTAPEKRALDNLTTEVPAGSVTAVLGMSGSGKSTLLGLLGLLLDDAATVQGRILWKSPENGQEEDYGALTRARRDWLRLHHFGFVLQSSYLLPNFPSGYNVQLPLMVQGMPPEDRRRALDRLLHTSELGMSELASLQVKRPAQLSGGERQRFAVLRAIIHDPSVVFADEPFASLDPENTGRVRDLLCHWQQGRLNDTRRARLLVLVTHAIYDAWKVADYFLLMAGGRFVVPDSRSPCDCLLTKKDLPGGPEQILELLRKRNHAQPTSAK